MTWFSQGLATASLSPFSVLLFKITVALFIIGWIVVFLLLIVAALRELWNLTLGIRTVITEEVDRILINRFRRLGKI